MDRLHSYVRPGVGVIVTGRRGGFFKKLFKGVAKVAKFVAPAVVAVAKTAAKHTVVGQIVTAVGKLKKNTAVGAASKAFNAAKRGDRGGGPDTPARRPPRRAKAKKRGKGRRPSTRRGGGTAKQRAARARFARAAKKGRIKKGQRL